MRARVPTPRARAGARAELPGQAELRAQVGPSAQAAARAQVGHLVAKRQEAPQAPAPAVWLQAEAADAPAPTEAPPRLRRSARCTATAWGRIARIRSSPKDVSRHARSRPSGTSRADRTCVTSPPFSPRTVTAPTPSAWGNAWTTLETRQEWLRRADE